MFSYRFHHGHIQGHRERGDAQLEALFVGINPEVMTPDSSISAAPCVLHGYLSMQVWCGWTYLSPRSQ